MARRSLIESPALPKGIYRVAKDRTRHIVKSAGSGLVTLQDLSQSSYLQGLHDALDMMMSRFPDECESMFGDCLKQPLERRHTTEFFYEVM